jgi:prefoldin subunit 5
MLDELNAIKAELQAELAAVDEEIQEIEDTLHPKTVDEVEQLQTKLQEALDELGKIKADLEKK